MVTLGHIDYLNCIPVHGAILLKKVPFNGKIITGNPSYLNKLLLSGDVDISPCSSIEILHGHYIVPDLSISSKSDVQSILLFTKKRIEEIEKGTILITSHSATSSLLTKIIFTEFYNVNLKYEIFDPTNNHIPISSDVIGILHIGDLALKFFFNNIHPESFKFKYDLAHVWYEKTKGLPFTFALWQIPEQSMKKSELKSTINALYESYSFFLDNKILFANFYQKKSGFNTKQIIEYWNHLDFSLEKKHMDSLKLFFELLKKNSLINKIPRFKFI